MRGLEQVLQRLFVFWENLVVVPQKFERNYLLGLRLVQRVLALRAEVEAFCGKHLNSKLLKTWLAFLDMVGFPRADIQKGLFKVLVSHEMELEQDLVNIRLLNNLVTSRKTAVLVVSADQELLGRILHASSMVQEVLGHQAFGLRGRNIKDLMPFCYAQRHDQLMASYLTKADDRPFKSRNIIGYVVNEQGEMSRVALFVKVYPHCDQEPKMVRSLDRPDQEGQRNPGQGLSAVHAQRADPRPQQQGALRLPHPPPVRRQGQQEQHPKVLSTACSLSCPASASCSLKSTSAPTPRRSSSSCPSCPSKGPCPT